MFRRVIGLAGAATAAAIALGIHLGDGASTAVAQEMKPSKALVTFDREGKLVRPVGYRHWMYIGTPLTPDDLNNGDAPFPEFHNVYIDPQSYAHYEKTGQFRDGTILVKELVGVGAKSATSGNGYFMGEFVGLEVSIKDKRRFASEPGNWAYFSFGHEYPLTDAAIKNGVASCNSCHQQSAKQDYVFTQYYPVIRAAAQ